MCCTSRLGAQKVPHVPPHENHLWTVFTGSDAGVRGGPFGLPFSSEGLAFIHFGIELGFMQNTLMHDCISIVHYAACNMHAYLGVTVKTSCVICAIVHIHHYIMLCIPCKCLCFILLVILLAMKQSIRC